MDRNTRIALALAAAPIVAATATAAALVLTGAHRRLGSTAGEIGAILPGDDILTGADLQNDHAITIAAPPSDVWPWIAQLGQDKAGFYSFEVLENAIGCEIHGVDRIVPEWQHPKVGEAFPLAPDVALRVALVDPPHTLVASSLGGTAPSEMGFDFTWAFHLTADHAGTRLHVRERYRTSGRAGHLVIEATSIASAIMTLRMLHRVRRLAELRR